MKVLIAVEGSEGDSRPALAVGARLKAIGHRVEACVPADYVSYFGERGINAFTMGVSTKEFSLVNAKSLYDRNLRMLRTLARLFPSYLERQFDSLLEHARDADVILCSGFMFAGGSIAEKLCKPMLHAVYSPVYLRSAFFPPPNIPFPRLPHVVNGLLWGGLSIALDLFALPSVEKHRKKLGLEPLGSLSGHLTKNMVLSMDPALAPLPAHLENRGTRQTAYPQLCAEEEMPVHVARFLDTGTPPVFIGFGSIPDPDSERRLTIVRQAVRKAGCRAVIDCGQAAVECHPPEGRDILLVGHLPHGKLFPRVAVVVHHGGAGTMHSAARAGVPQIVVPHFLDQYFHASRVEQLGLGPHRIRWRSLTAPRLTRRLQDALGSATYRRNAFAFGEKLRRSDGAAELAEMVMTCARGG